VLFLKHKTNIVYRTTPFTNYNHVYFYSKFLGRKISTNSFKLNAATIAAFDGCEDNLLQNGSFESSLQGWANSPNTSFGRATTYASDGSYHSWILPTSGTAEAIQYIDADAGDDFTFNFAAGVHDPTGNHKVGFQFLDFSGAVLETHIWSI